MRLRERTSKLDRPFQEHTITNYTVAARTHTQGGTNTLQGVHRRGAADRTRSLVTEREVVKDLPPVEQLTVQLSQPGSIRRLPPFSPDDVDLGVDDRLGVGSVQ